MSPYLTTLFYFHGETVLVACVSRATTKKVVNFFRGKKCIWVEDFLTSKWPGSFTALAPPLFKKTRRQTD